jgi:uncharacterized protein (TIGR02646 family)
MIRVTKGTPPDVLKKRAAAAHKVLTDLYKHDPTSYDNGKQFPYNLGLYAHKEVRKRLSKTHYGKCCYCEIKIPVPYASSHVEHFRPKAYSQQKSGSKRRYPGYYWLVYEWTNLYLSCQFCNVSHKRNVFPLGYPARRAKKKGDDLSLESASLIDPAGTEDPRDHIEFHDEVPRGKTAKGATTISVIGLDDGAHDEWRRERLAELRELIERIELHRADTRPKVKKTVEDARLALTRATMADAPFSSMAQDFLAKHPIP